MFRRRKPLSVFNQLRAVLWPARGFRRLFSYLFQRIIRLPGTPVSIASGFASGVAASFTPFIGFHFFIGGALAMLLRGNVLASAIGTFFGNPWTFIPIWLADYKAGLGVLRAMGYGDTMRALTIEELGVILSSVLQFMSLSGNMSSSELFIKVEHVLMPMLIGGVVLGIIAWLVSFLLSLWAVKVWRVHRAKRLLKMVHNSANFDRDLDARR
ncbi:DUF2062 domain-containing protein [Candidatus Puniceispirillum sp.]|nr:DUF2062 domain-containing protein [Candidatus Puniceispirillum sp.]